MIAPLLSLVLCLTEHCGSADGGSGFSDALQRRDTLADQRLLRFGIKVLGQTRADRGGDRSLCSSAHEGPGVGLVIRSILTKFRGRVVLHQQRRVISWCQGSGKDFFQSVFVTPQRGGVVKRIAHRRYLRQPLAQRSLGRFVRRIKDESLPVGAVGEHRNITSRAGKGRKPPSLGRSGSCQQL